MATAPTGSAATRLAAILTVGSRLAVTAVLLGDWPIGATWHLNPDGTTTGEDQASQPERRVNTLDETAAAVVLHTLRQAHPADDAADGADDGAAPTQSPSPSLPSLARASPDQAAHLPGHGLLPAHRQPGPIASSGPRVDTGTVPRMQLSVLGRPTVHAGTGTVGSDLRIRRSDGIQLLVYLAVEPSGATSDELMALLWPEIRPRHSRGRFHTTLSELRHTLVDALGADPIARTHDRYHLDPNLVEVDLWNLAAAGDRAATAVEPAHHAALHDLIALYTGAVAEGHTWLWLDPYRETVRRHVLDAYATLAETEPDPHAALALIQDAIRVDPYNEHLYQLAMHLHARLGSPDGVRRTLRTITKRLGELEIPLSPRTQQTASLLIERLDLRERLRPTT